MVTSGCRPNSANRASYAKVVASRSSTAVAQQAAAAEAVEMAVEAAAKTAPRKLLAHVRFSFDRAHLRRMHAALRVWCSFFLLCMTWLGPNVLLTNQTIRVQGESCNFVQNALLHASIMH